MKIIPATNKNFAYAQISDKEYEAIEKSAVNKILATLKEKKSNRQ